MGFSPFDKLNIKQAFTFRRKALCEDATLRAFFKSYLFIWLCQVSHSGGLRTLSCSKWDLVPDQGLNLGPLHWECKWDLVPDQGLNLGPLHWECSILASGPPGKSYSREILSEKRYEV